LEERKKEAANVVREDERPPAEKRWTMVELVVNKQREQLN
jgi:hypothetical protein